MKKYYGMIRTENEETDKRTTALQNTKEEAVKEAIELLKKYDGIGYLIKEM